MSLLQEVNAYLGHPGVGMDSIAISATSLDRVRQLVDELPRHAVIVALTDDSVFKDSRGSDVKAAVDSALTGLGSILWVTLPGPVHADEATVASALFACRDADVLVTVGSGTLADIGKVVAGTRPHVIVQTAASVNGFADDQSVLLINGVKRTTPSGWPTALVVDGRVLEGAPAALNRSGLGDLLSMFTAPADWYLSRVFGMDKGWSSDVATMARQHGDTLLAAAEGIGRNDPQALTVLAELLTLSGMSMGVAGQTAPSSGMEHTVSHLLDMAKGAKGMPTAQHGAQVGVATVVTSILWRRMIERFSSGSVGRLEIPTVDDAERNVRRAFDHLDTTGATSDECWNDYSKKLQHLSAIDAPAVFEQFVGSWESHRTQLADLLEEPELIAGALTLASAPARFSELDNASGRDDIEWALLSCHLMRNRFTIADLAFLTGWWTMDEVRSVLDEASAFGGGL